jgi:hypothetical protein
MNKDHIPCCAADALWRVRQVKINGVMTGITMLDESIAAVAEENLISGDAIQSSLVRRIRASNYIPPGSEEAYGKALMEEYHKALLKRNERKPGTEK